MVEVKVCYLFFLLLRLSDTKYVKRVISSVVLPVVLLLQFFMKNEARGVEGAGAKCVIQHIKETLEGGGEGARTASWLVFEIVSLHAIIIIYFCFDTWWYQVPCIT